MNIKLTGFASGAKPIGNFQIEQIGDEIVMTSPKTHLYSSDLSPAQLLAQQQEREGLLQRSLFTVSTTPQLTENKISLKK